MEELLRLLDMGVTFKRDARGTYIVVVGVYLDEGVDVDELERNLGEGPLTSSNVMVLIST